MRGLIKPSALVEWSKKHGVRGAAVTDYGTLAAAFELHEACKGTSVMPIYGMEINLVDDKTEKSQTSLRLILIAKNKQGFRNLITLATIGAMYFYYIPRLDITDLEDYGGDLIAISGDMQGVAADAYFRDQDNGLKNLWDIYTAIFGDDFYFEIEPALIDSQRVLNEALVKFALSVGTTNLVATGDPHYMVREDRDLHKCVMAIKNNRNPSWYYPMKGDYHVRTYDEMVDQFAELHGYDISNVPGFREALKQPDVIIDKIESFDICEGVKIPTFIK
tara:strand:- start:209 stop:1036 length:828 start_codon:yes stop_codon:yes gene_type:complete